MFPSNLNIRLGWVHILNGIPEKEETNHTCDENKTGRQSTRMITVHFFRGCVDEVNKITWFEILNHRMIKPLVGTLNGKEQG